MKHIRILLFIVVLGFLALPALAVITDDPTEFGGNARAIGLGGAYTAISNDPNAIFYNPAGLSNIKSLQITGMYYSRIFGSYDYVTGGGVIPTPYGVLGIGYVGGSSNGIAVTNTSSVLGDDASFDNVLILSYGSSMGRFVDGWQRLFVGTSAKVFNRGFYGTVNDSGNGFNMDVGVKYIPVSWIMLGISKSNILSRSMGGGINWTTGMKEDLTSLTRLGVAVKLLDNRALIGLDAKIPSAAEEPTLLGLGGEYALDDHVVLRSGFAWNIDAQSNAVVSVDPSLGIGFKFDSMSLDYAYRPYFNDSSNNTTHYISLSYDEDISKLLNIKIGKLDSEKLRDEVMKKYPGKIYDDLGHLVSGEETSDQYQMFKWAEAVASMKGYVPVSADIIDYDRLYAVLSDIKVAKEEQNPGKYGPGDVIPIIVEAPYDTDNVVAVMPNGEEIKLAYDSKAVAWYGIWKVPEGIDPGIYRSRAYATDFEGTKVAVESTPFIIEGKTGAVIPSKEVTTTTVTENAPAAVATAEEPVSGIGGPVKTEVIGINLTAPDDKTISYGETIRVKGIAGKEMISIKVNGSAVNIGAGGAFSVLVPLTLGKNAIVVEGLARDNAKAELERRVLRLSVPTDATAEELKMIKQEPLEKEALLTEFSDILGRALRGSNTITRADAGVVIASIKGLALDGSQANPFKDVPPSYWAYSKIKALKDAKLVNGYPDGTFMPSRKISLAEFATIVLRSEGIPHPKPAGSGPYWAMGVIAKVKELKMFSDAENCTVKEFKRAAILETALEIMLSTKTGSEKAVDILDWDKGY